MASSMTGYGRAEVTGQKVSLGVEVRALNHKFLEITCKLPRPLASLEPEVRHLVQGCIHRGRIDVSVTARLAGSTPGRVRMDLDLARQYLAAMRELAETLELGGHPDLRLLLQCREVLRLEEVEEGLDEEVGIILRNALGRALTTLGAMRRQEGEALVEALGSHLKTVEELVEGMAGRIPEALACYRERIRDRIRELLGGLQVDEGRLAMEVALWAEKTDVAEELARLRSHLGQFREQLTAGGAIGRTLDFLVQEMNREVNTIASKADDLAITQAVIHAKGELEKIREQVQNLE